LTGAAIVALLQIGGELRRQTELLADIQESLGVVVAELQALGATLVRVAKDRELLEAEGAVERATVLLERGLVLDSLALSRKAVLLNPASSGAWLAVVRATGARVLAAPPVSPTEAQSLWAEGTEAVSKALRLSPFLGSSHGNSTAFYAGLLGAAEFFRSEVVAAEIVGHLLASYRAASTLTERQSHPAVTLLAQVARGFPRLARSLTDELDRFIAAKLTKPFLHLEQLGLVEGFVRTAHVFGCPTPATVLSVLRFDDATMTDVVGLLANYSSDAAGEIVANPSRPDRWPGLFLLRDTLRAHLLGQWVMKGQPIVQGWQRAGIVDKSTSARMKQDAMVRELTLLCLYLDFGQWRRRTGHISSAVVVLAVAGVLAALLAWALGSSQEASSMRATTAVLAVFCLATASASPWWRGRASASLLRRTLGDLSPVEFAERLRDAGAP